MLKEIRQLLDAASEMPGGNGRAASSTPLHRKWRWLVTTTNFSESSEYPRAN